MNLNGGHASRGYLQSVWNRRFDLNTGTIELTGNRTIGTDPAIIDLFGASPSINVGKGLTVWGNATVSSPLTLNGGTLRP